MGALRCGWEKPTSCDPVDAADLLPAILPACKRPESFYNLAGRPSATRCAQRLCLYFLITVTCKNEQQHSSLVNGIETQKSEVGGERRSQRSRRLHCGPLRSHLETTRSTKGGWGSARPLQDRGGASARALHRPTRRVSMRSAVPFECHERVRRDTRAYQTPRVDFLGL